MTSKKYDSTHKIDEIGKSTESIKVEATERTANINKFPKRKSVPYRRLFRFVEGIDKLLVFLLVVTSIGVGAATPLTILIFKDVINILVRPQPNMKYTDALHPLIVQFAILASAVFVCGFVQMICISLTASRQGRRLKSNYFSALLRQEISWFDKQQTGQMITKLTDDIESIEVAISDKLAQFIQQISLFIISVIIVLTSDWKLTLVGCVAIPLMCIVFFCMIHFIKKYAIAQVRAYSIAGGIAEEILSSVRTVVSFNAQDSEVLRYTSNLSKAEALGVKKSICIGLGAGSVGLSVFSVGSLVFYVGLQFLYAGSYQPGVVIQVFLTIVIGSISLGNAIPIIENFMTAKVAGYAIFEIIDKIPIIDYKAIGVIPDSFCGDITFKDVNFEYPTRAGIPILQNFNFILPYGKTVAFIGPSGSGKSTIIHLLQRFYDPVSGEITMNGTNLKNFDINWYRSNIGVVQQEPPLFSGTIKENIQLGKLNATEEEVIISSKDSNAYNFIMDTSEKFDTPLGDRGAGFSGGQKQRIAIATALVRDPVLLLLDEATSALDNKSEKLVQSVLDKNIADKKRTIVMVAHRLQTVRNADIIVVMKNGIIIEQGNHQDLISAKGLYWEMLESQKTEEEKTEEEVVQITKESKIELKELLDRKKSIAEMIPLIEIKKSEKFLFFKDMIRLLVINKQESGLLFVGVLASIVVGITFPGASLIYAQMFQIFAYQQTDPQRMLSEGYVFCGLLLLPALSLFFSQILKNYCLGKSGEILTRKLRSLIMASMLNQEMGWFDEPQNLPGILTARLAMESTLVKGAAVVQLSVYIEAISNLISSCIIGFFFSWQLTLLFFIFIPLITMLGIIQGKLSSGQRLSGSANVNTSALVMEVLNNIRITNSLGLQKYFSDKYLDSLKLDTNASKIIIYGFVCGLSTSALTYAYCVVFLVGSVLIDQQQIVMIQLMRVFACFTMSSAALGRALASAPDTDKARKATRKCLTTIDRKTNIDANTGIIPDKKLTGNIEFKNIYFQYPTRTNVSVLRSLNLTVKAGDSVALVGHSGCGKSTLIQLLQRYYDPTLKENVLGQIFLDGHDLKYLNLSWVRNQIGLVKQEPSLFNLTVKQNILYGSKDSENMEEIIDVCKMANIHDFIESLPEKYNTLVGQRGGHLSGGQKQRLCIARALYKKPVILLLDEATSALDTQSEILVQEALEKAQSLSTNLVIAHRLSTIKNSNQIAIIDNGEVIELGTHDELMEKKGNYFELNMEHIK